MKRQIVDAAAIGLTLTVLVSALGTAASPSGSPTAGPVVAPSMVPEPPLEVAWSVPAPEGTQAWGIGIDPQGRIWVTVSDGTIAVLDRDGNQLETWGSPGTGAGEFDFVSSNGPFGDIAFRPDGGFYVADTGNVRVQQFDADRSFVRAWGTFGTDDGQFVGPAQVDLDGAGNVYVLDPDRADIQVFDADGAFLRTLPIKGPFLAVDDAGSVYNVDESTRTLERSDPDGTITAIATLEALLPFATGIGLMPSGGILVSSEASGTVAVGPGNLVELDPDGNVTHVWPSGGWELAIDPAGDRLYMPMPFGADVALARAVVLPPE